MSVIVPDDLRESFLRDGFVAIRPLFDHGEMADLNIEMARYIRDVVPTMPDARVYYEDKNDPSSLKQVQKLLDYDGYFAGLMNGIIRRMAETVLADDVVAVNMQYFNKPAGIGQATPPHQDGYYFHLSPCEAVTGWLALDDVNEENGCIHYVRGSHKSDRFRPHGQTGVLGFSQGITDFGTAADRGGSSWDRRLSGIGRDVLDASCEDHPLGRPKPIEDPRPPGHWFHLLRQAGT